MTGQVKFVLGSLLLAGAASAAAIALDHGGKPGTGKDGSAPGGEAAVVKEVEVPLDPALIKQGEGLYTSLGCIACHSNDGSMRVGPSFGGLYGKTEKLQGGHTVHVGPDYIRQSILDPTAKIVAGYVPTMPAFQGRLQNTEVDALIAYIRSLNQK